MPTIQVRLSPELADFLESEVSAGPYASADEVLTQALQDWKDGRTTEAAKLAALRHEIALGLDSIERGDVSTRSVADIFRSAIDQAP